MQHVQTTFAAFASVVDLEGADEMFSAAFRSHQEALALLAG